MNSQSLLFNRQMASNYRQDSEFCLQTEKASRNETLRLVNAKEIDSSIKVNSR